MSINVTSAVTSTPQESPLAVPVACLVMSTTAEVFAAGSCACARHQRPDQPWLPHHGREIPGMTGSASNRWLRSVQIQRLYQVGRHREDPEMVGSKHWDVSTSVTARDLIGFLVLFHFEPSCSPQKASQV